MCRAAVEGGLLGPAILGREHGGSHVQRPIGCPGTGIGEDEAFSGVFQHAASDFVLARAEEGFSPHVRSGGSGHVVARLVRRPQEHLDGSGGEVVESELVRYRVGRPIGLYQQSGGVGAFLSPVG